VARRRNSAQRSHLPHAGRYGELSRRETSTNYLTCTVCRFDTEELLSPSPSHRHARCPFVDHSGRARPRPVAGPGINRPTSIRHSPVREKSYTVPAPQHCIPRSAQLPNGRTRGTTAPGQQGSAFPRITPSRPSRRTPNVRPPESVRSMDRQQSFPDVSRRCPTGMIVMLAAACSGT
jgi:hypothetical protein